MIRRFDVCDPAQVDRAIAAAVSAVRRGELVVVPTESAYGVATDAFRADGLERIRTAKNRGRELPIPVLVGQPSTIDGLIANLSIEARALSAAFWPGLLTLVAIAQPSLSWEVGPLDDHTVSVRMPLHPIACRLAKEVGPLALTGANVAGSDLPRTCDEAANQLGSAVKLYLDAGPVARSVGSTVVDVSVNPPVLLREGAVSIDQLRAVCPDVVALPDPSTNPSTS